MNLELVTTKALCAELLTRFDHVIISGIKERDVISQFKGEHILCQGLAARMVVKLEHSIVDHADYTQSTDEDL